MLRNHRMGTRLLLLLMFAVFIAGVIQAQAVIPGVTGTSFNLAAREGYLSTGDGNSFYAWGFAIDNEWMQYPGPTIIVNQNDAVTITLTNDLPAWAGNVSILFPGLSVQASGGQAGQLTREAPPDGATTVTYTFTATRPGTFLYHGGTRPGLQMEMGLVGAIIVRPAGFNPAAPRAYDDPVSDYDSAYDHEYLFLLSAMDSRIHDLLEFKKDLTALDEVNYLSDYFPNYYFINGRTSPDVFSEPFVEWLPHQPYNSLPRMHPGERLLMRVLNGGLKRHPFHHHGNHARVIAKQGQLLASMPGVGADLSYEVFTIESVPGETVDAIFQWTGEKIGWDIYGDPNHPDYAHDCIDNDMDGYDDVTHEWCADHGKPFPVVLPEKQNLAFGAFYSGSPFLGTMGTLPPGEGGLNPNSGYAYMWHSHDEKELTNFGLFPGGILTMLIIEPPGVPIP
ncbi:MAG: multicopper oxidase domain-containing protein [Acidobacteria bacterium]|nr:multicopper oxidase domain-containing protein [Acidobacteriota bacterium]